MVRKPYRHFWRSQFEKILVVVVVAGLLVVPMVWPSHPWLDELKVFVAQALTLLFVHLRRGTWTDPENGEGGKSPEDQESRREDSQ